MFVVSWHGTNQIVTLKPNKNTYKANKKHIKQQTQSFLFSFLLTAVEITQPFPTNINALSGTRQSTTCHATGQGQPPDLVKFVIKEGFNKPRDIPSKGRVYQTKAVIKGW